MANIISVKEAKEKKCLFWSKIFASQMDCFADKCMAWETTATENHGDEKARHGYCKLHENNPVLML